MANTYSQIYIQVVFAVSARQCLIAKTFKEELYKYIAGIIESENQKLIAINGMPDHITYFNRAKAKHGFVKFGGRD